MRNQRFLLTLITILFVASILSLLVTLALSRLRAADDVQYVGKASAAGELSFCINQPPTVDASNCSSIASQNTTYACTINGSDYDSGQTVTITTVFLTGTPFFNASANGTISVTPTNDQVGNYTIQFVAQDSSGCGENEAITTLALEVLNINDPPYLVTSIPNQTFEANTTLSAFFLDDYFADPDGDVLTYTASVPSTFTVTILGSSEVRFSSTSCNEDGELVTFTAEDPYNATAESNAIVVVIECPSPSGGGGSSGGSGGGGGGGGGNVCLSEWECEEWFACLPNDLQWRRCYDTNGCKSDRYLKRHCIYEGPPPACEENWLCEEWSACFINNTQTRTCEDLSGCGSTLTLPTLVQGCTYLASCNDGLQNGDETGVDCGGSCLACPLLESPSLISTGGRLTWILLIILLALLLATGVARYYRGEIARLLARLGFWLERRTPKEILLDAQQRKMLFERIRIFERQELRKAEETYDGLGMLIRAYTHEALGVPLEAVPEEVAAACKRLGLSHVTSGLITGLYAKVDVVEEQELEEDAYFVAATLEEIRTLVCLTSEYTHEEIARPIQEAQVVESMSFYDELYVRMTNILRAVQFDQNELARSEYLAMLTRYDGLTLQEQEQIYPELSWVFAGVKLQEELAGVRIVEKRSAAA